MCDCNVNIYNISDNGNDDPIIYNMDNVGIGSNVYKEAITIGNTTTFYLRSLTATSPISLIENTNDIRIEDLSIQPGILVVGQFYMRTITVDFSGAFVAPFGLGLSTVPEIQQFGEGYRVVLTPTSFTFIPGPRCKKSVIIPVQLESTLTRSNINIKIQPDIKYAEDFYDYITATSTLSTNIKIYDSNVSPIIDQDMNYPGGSDIVFSGTLKCIATDINDNIIFFVKLSEPTRLYYYDASTNIEVVFINSINNQALFSALATIQDLCYDNTNNVLYVLPDIANTPVLMITVKPFDRAQGLQYSTIFGLNFPTTIPNYSPASIAVDENTETIYYFLYSNLFMSTRIRVYYKGSSSYSQTTSIALVNPRATFMASGQLAVFNATGNTIGFFENGGISNGITRTITINTPKITSLSRSIYGVINN